MTPTSNCCNAPVKVSHGPGTWRRGRTSWYECTKCGEVCEANQVPFTPPTPNKQKCCEKCYSKPEDGLVCCFVAGFPKKYWCDCHKPAQPEGEDKHGPGHIMTEDCYNSPKCMESLKDNPYPKTEEWEKDVLALAKDVDSHDMLLGVVQSLISQAKQQGAREAVEKVVRIIQNNGYDPEPIEKDLVRWLQSLKKGE